MSKMNEEKINLINELKELCSPNVWENKNSRRETEYAILAEKFAIDIANWDSPGRCYEYIEPDGKMIDDNLNKINELDINIAVATLICIYREQRWDSYEDVISPRIESGRLLRLIERIEILYENI